MKSQVGNEREEMDLFFGSLPKKGTKKLLGDETRK